MEVIKQRAAADRTERALRRASSLGLAPFQGAIAAASQRGVGCASPRLALCMGGGGPSWLSNAAF
jgi:hypothetical protein